MLVLWIIILLISVQVDGLLSTKGIVKCIGCSRNTIFEGHTMEVEYILIGKDFQYMEIKDDGIKRFHGYPNLYKKPMNPNLINPQFNFTFTRPKNDTWRVILLISDVKFDKQDGHTISYEADFKSEWGKEKGSFKITVDGETREQRNKRLIYFSITAVIIAILTRLCAWLFLHYKLIGKYWNSEVNQKKKAFICSVGITSYYYSFEQIKIQLFQKRKKGCWSKMFRLHCFFAHCIPVIMIVVGFTYLDQCPAAKLIPWYSVFSGLFISLSNLPWYFIFYRSTLSKDHLALYFSSICDSITELFHCLGVGYILVNFRGRFLWDESEYVGCHRFVFRAAFGSSLYFIMYFAVIILRLIFLAIRAVRNNKNTNCISLNDHTDGATQNGHPPAGHTHDGQTLDGHGEGEHRKHPLWGWPMFDEASSWKEEEKKLKKQIVHSFLSQPGNGGYATLPCSDMDDTGKSELADQNGVS